MVLNPYMDRKMHIYNKIYINRTKAMELIQTKLNAKPTHAMLPTGLCRNGNPSNNGRCTISGG